MRQPRAVRFTSSGGTVRVLHIETAGAIVDIRIGLHDTGGNEVTSIEILPDPGWTLDGHALSRVVRAAEPHRHPERR